MTGARARSELYRLFAVAENYPDLKASTNFMQLQAELSDTALQVATALSAHPKVAKVIYPGLASHPQHALAMAQMGSGGTLVTFEIAGGKEAAFRFMNALEIAKISNNLGDAKTIATHPATTTHQRLPQDQKDALGITPGLIRLSLGLEDAGDLIADLPHA